MNGRFCPTIAQKLALATLFCPTAASIAGAQTYTEYPFYQNAGSPADSQLIQASDGNFYGVLSESNESEETVVD